MHLSNREQSSEVGKPIKLNPKKLLLSKWTKVEVVAKQKHFLVSGIVQPDDLSLPITEIEIEAVYSGSKKLFLGASYKMARSGNKVGCDMEFRKAGATRAAHT